MADNIWLALAIWVVSYCADYYLTLYSARLYRAQAQAHFAFEGSLELTPYYQADIDGLRRISPRFLLALLLSLLGLELIWYLSHNVAHLPALFEFAIGALVLREAAILLRHCRNISLFRGVRDPRAVEGQVTYARWLSLRTSAVDLFSFAGLYGLLALAVGSCLLAGGALACAARARLIARLMCPLEDSDLQPHGCKPCALPIELRGRCAPHYTRPGADCGAFSARRLQGIQGDQGC